LRNLNKMAGQNYKSIIVKFIRTVPDGYEIEYPDGRREVVTRDRVVNRSINFVQVKIC